MTSKEALEKLYDGYQYGMAGRSFYDLIKQDLDRLEALEEIHKDDTKQIKELKHQLNIYKTNYYELDEAIIELINKFKVVRGNDRK